MAAKNELRVHLDHIIKKQSLRYVGKDDGVPAFNRSKDDPPNPLRYKDLEDHDGIVPWLRKPDFQRETSAWTPEKCVDLLESVVRRWVIPGLIMWRNDETDLVYVLDGAHRISVLLAWMLDDWGDRAPAGYYERNKRAGEIERAAITVRELVKRQIGDYASYKEAYQKYLKAQDDGDVSSLREDERTKGSFYRDIRSGAKGFHVQWEFGDYNVAEASFLRINRTGQQLNTFETTLIENRNSTLARAVMSVANGGSGHFWPELSSPVSKSQLQTLNEMATGLHRKLFVPSLEGTIQSLAVPFMVAPGYFQKHALLMELFPVFQGKSGQPDDITDILEEDNNASGDAILANGMTLMYKAVDAMSQLTGEDNDSRTLNLVPLFYFYSNIGRYVRSALYGFISWLNQGSEEEVRTRKIIFSAHRERFEQVLFRHNIAGIIPDRIGSGPRATFGTADFYERLLRLLNSNSHATGDPSFEKELGDILAKLAVPRSEKRVSESRVATKTQKNAVVIKKLFENSARCHICGGILNMSEVQYDHKKEWHLGGESHPDNFEPTHPFCNNMREEIEEHKKDPRSLVLPKYKKPRQRPDEDMVQGNFFQFINFPDA
ncbi:MAG: HNH endonuclease signature motif containing protein [Anaerolineae bacterium]